MIQLIAGLALAQAPDLDRFIYPLAPAIGAPEITVDSSAAPDLAEWGEKAKALAMEWHPLVSQLLSTQDWRPPAKIALIFRTGQAAPAYATRNEISISADWVRSRPDDLGMIVHELTHIIQAYPRSEHNTGWLVEGIADYIRWWRYEPEAPRSRTDFSRANYTDAYRTTANWLAWAAKKHTLRLVPALDLKLRRAEDPMPVFKELTGKTADELWADYKAEMTRQ
jgi:hypothetical protein